MKKRWAILVLAAMSFTGFGSAAEAAVRQAPQSVRDQAARYSRAAREMIAAGRVTDGVKMMRLAIKTNPLDPMLRMNYVTIMSKKGEQSLSEGRRSEAIAVFRSVEEELMSAAKLFKDGGSPANAAHVLSQVAQIYRYVYQNEGKARAYFDKALELDPSSAQIRSLALSR